MIDSWNYENMRVFSHNVLESMVNVRTFRVELVGCLGQRPLGGSGDAACHNAIMTAPVPQIIIRPASFGRAMRAAESPYDDLIDRVEAIVVEDDTYHALCAEPVFEPVEDHPIRVLDAAHGSEPATPGDVVVRPGTPLRLLAIVHKLDEDPSWRESWIIAAYEAVVREIDGRRLGSVALPLLGTVHGRLSRARSHELLTGVVEGSAGCFELLAPPELAAELFERGEV